MLAKERQNRIQKLLQKDGAVTTAGLVKQFDVSVETIRRDFLVMEQNGQLTRVHGGAVAGGEMTPFLDLEHRNKERYDEKKELSAVAARFVSQGDYIAVDTGSTAIAFAEALKERFTQLTVVTYSVDVFELLRDYRDFSVILCGGHYLKNEKSFYGSLTLEMLERMHVQKSFICPSAISMEFGICDYQQDLYPLEKKLMENSDSVFILADSSKFGKKALLKLEDMRREFSYITDGGLSAELKNLYAENGLRIYNNPDDLTGNGWGGTWNE